MHRRLVPLAAVSLTTLTALAMTGDPAGASPLTTAASVSTCALPGSGYGRLLPNLPSATWDRTAIDSLAAQIMAPAETDPTPEGQRDAEENVDIAAGYTYFGQFIDHDLTLDNRPNDLTTPVALSSLVNGRTPQLDLDSVYGTGPAGSPALYADDHMHMKVGTALTGSADAGAVDLPRDATTGQALIGDPRNDENRIVAGIHSLFLRLHNQVVDRIRTQQPALDAATVFAKARQEVTWDYQWIIVNDFLPTIAGQNTVDTVVRHTPKGWSTNLRWWTPCTQMPVEFSVAAYRFGHSMVRGLYRINDSVDRLPVFSGTYQPSSDLTGFSPAPSNFAIDWKYFVPTSPNSLGTAQPSYKIDASLTHSLSLLPLPTTGSGPADLSVRNLLRGEQVGLPSGQDVARAMGITPLPDDQILIGKATGDATEAKAITAISPAFAGKAPLWAYVLAEATAQSYVVRNGAVVGNQVAPFRLGPVGGRIVTETIVGLMASDPASLLNHPEFQPHPRVPGSRFNLRGFIDLVTAPRPTTPATPAAPAKPAPPATSGTQRPQPPRNRPAPAPRRRAAAARAVHSTT